jgi:hypothetical protein
METITEAEWIQFCIDNNAEDTGARVFVDHTEVYGTVKGKIYTFILEESR